MMYWIIIIWCIIGVSCFFYLESNSNGKQKRKEYFGWLIASCCLAPVFLIGVIMEFLEENEWLNEEV